MMIPPVPWHRPRVRAARGDRVVLLHGLWRSVWAMDGVAEYLHGEGFETLNVPYASFRKPLDEIIEDVAAEIGKSEKTTHFVTHSMGGIVVRLLADRFPELVTGKIAMLAPPNQGSEIIDWLSDSFVGRWALGPGGMAMSTQKTPLEIPGFKLGNEVMVIMGESNPMPLFRFLLDEENDGIVSVEKGKVEGMSKFRVRPGDHTFIMGRPEIQVEVGEFLKATGPQD